MVEFFEMRNGIAHWSVLLNAFGIRSVALIHSEAWDRVEERLGSDYRVDRPSCKDTTRRLGKPVWGVMGQSKYVRLFRQLTDKLIADVLMHAI